MNPRFPDYLFQSLEIYNHLKSFNFTDSDIRNTLGVLMYVLELFSDYKKEK